MKYLTAISQSSSLIVVHDAQTLEVLYIAKRESSYEGVLRDVFLWISVNVQKNFLVRSVNEMSSLWLVKCLEKLSKDDSKATKECRR